MMDGKVRPLPTKTVVKGRCSSEVADGYDNVGQRTEDHICYRGHSESLSDDMTCNHF